MIVRGLPVEVFDIEVFKNCYSCTIYNTETKETFVFEISKRRNDSKKLVEHFKNQNILFCGYNNKHYDDPINNFIILNAETIPDDYLLICKTISHLSDTIINSEDSSSWKEWKYANCYKSFDLLTMLFSSKLRVGLKEMQVTMHYPNVQEYEGDFTKELPEDEIDNMLKYNLNDVMSTAKLLELCEKDIRLRENIEKEFGIDVMSKDGMTIGVEILKTKYLEKTGKSWWDIKGLRSPCEYIALKEVIFPFISFKMPVLQRLLEEMKQQVVTPGRKGYEKHFLLDGVEITVGVGGIHSRNDPETIIPKEDERLLDSDVNSLYPSLIISYKLVPPHLGEEFLEVYGGIRTERLYAKHHPEIPGNSVKNTTLKLALNGASGQYQNQYNWMYAPKEVMKIRMNGQLLLLMLAERLILQGAHIKQLNTDGILYTIPKSVNLDTILKEWEDLTKLTLETEEYEAFYQFAINDYLAVGKGYSETKNPKLLKYKGLFIETNSLGKGMAPPIIAKAINEHLLTGRDIREIVTSSKDINDFLTYQKIDKKFSAEYNGKIVSHINRYYASTDGYHLFKCVKETKEQEVPAVILHFKNGECKKVPQTDIEPNGKYWYNPEVSNIEYGGYKISIPKDSRHDYEDMLKASGVTIVNNLEDIKEFPNNINYSYYINEVQKIVSSLKEVQLSLF